MCLPLCILELVAFGVGERAGASCICSHVCWTGFQAVTSEPPITVSPELSPPAECLTFMCFCLSWVDIRSALPLEMLDLDGVA